MFSKEISGLTLTNGIASTLFQNITGNKFRSDESFVATLRALLHSRVPKEESVTLQYSSTDYSAGQLSDSAPRDCVRAFIRDTNITYGENGILLIHSFEGRSEEDNTACFKVLDEGVPKAVKGSSPWTICRTGSRQPQSSARRFTSTKKGVAPSSSRRR